MTIEFKTKREFYDKLFEIMNSGNMKHMKRRTLYKGDKVTIEICEFEMIDGSRITLIGPEEQAGA